METILFIKISRTYIKNKIGPYYENFNINRV